MRPRISHILLVIISLFLLSTKFYATGTGDKSTSNLYSGEYNNPGKHYTPLLLSANAMYMAPAELTSVKINSGNPEAFTVENLIATLSGTIPANAGLVYDWQVSIDDGVTYKSTKLIDFNFEVQHTNNSFKNYADGNIISVTNNSNLTYQTTGGAAGDGYLNIQGQPSALGRPHYVFNFPELDFTNQTYSVWYKGKPFSSSVDDGPNYQKIFSNSNKDVLVVSPLSNTAGSLPQNQIGYSKETSGGSFTNEYINSGWSSSNSNNWINVILVMKGSEVTMYLNGSQIASKTTSRNTGVQSNADITLSDERAAINGGVDHFQVFNRALSPEQVQELYNQNYDKIVAAETTVNEKWKLCVTPYDENGDGDKVCGNEILISPPKIEGAQINTGASECISAENLELTYSAINPTDSKVISDWQVDNGSGFESIKIIDMPFDGGTMGDGINIKNYINGVSSFQGTGVSYKSDEGYDSKGCYHFNNSSIRFNDSERTPFLDAAQSSITMSVWIKTTSEGVIYSYYGCYLGINDVIELNIVGNDMKFAMRDKNANTYELIYNQASELKDNKWHHIVTVFEANNFQSLYIDGVRKEHQNVGEFDGFVRSNSVKLYLGLHINCESPHAPGDQYSGYIDDFKVYKRALSQEQIEAMFNNCLNPDGSYNGNFRDDIIVADETKTGEKWKVVAIPNDNEFDGNSVESNQINIVSTPISCKGYKDKGITDNGVYKIDPDGESGNLAPFSVFCDFTTEGLNTESVSSGTALKSCTSHRALYPDNFEKDGLYVIDPDGLIENGVEPFVAHCDMTTSGGGWTMVYRYSDDQTLNTKYLYHGDSWTKGIGDITNESENHVSKIWHTLTGMSEMLIIRDAEGSAQGTKKTYSFPETIPVDKTFEWMSVQTEEYVILSPDEFWDPGTEHGQLSRILLKDDESWYSNKVKNLYNRAEIVIGGNYLYCPNSKQKISYGGLRGSQPGNQGPFSIGHQKHYTENDGSCYGNDVRTPDKLSSDWYITKHRMFVRTSEVYIPVINSFTADRNESYIGNSFNLLWSVEDADVLKLQSDDHDVYTVPVEVTGNSIQITAPATEGVYTYKLIAINSEGISVDKSIRIKVFDDYRIDYSLRLDNDDNQYMSKSFSSDGDGRRWTFSAFVKFTNTESSSVLFSSDGGSYKSHWISTGYNAADDLNRIAVVFMNGGTDVSTRYHVSTTGKFTDQSKWYHIVVIYNSDEDTEADRVKIYVDGNRENLIETASGFPVKNYQTYFSNSSYTHYIGKRDPASGNASDYYMAEVNFVDGEAQDVSAFGKIEDGEWVPKRYTGEYGVTGYYLNFSDQTDPGKDMSVNNNHWILNGSWTKDGVKYIDQMLDSPTNNYGVLNREYSSADRKISNGNMRVEFVTNSSSWKMFPSTVEFDNDNVYYEVQRLNSSNSLYRESFGIAQHDIDFSGSYITSSDKYNYISEYITFGAPSGATEAMAFKASEKGMWIKKYNNIWVNNPEQDTEPNVTIESEGPYLPMVGGYTSDHGNYHPYLEVNFGQGGKTGLKDYKLDTETGVWTEITDQSIVPDARFKYHPPNGFHPVSEPFIGPFIKAFYSDLLSVKPGAEITLKWVVENAVKKEIYSINDNNYSTPVDVSNLDSHTFTSPSEPGVYSYTIKCYNSRGVASEESLTIIVNNNYKIPYSLRFDSDKEHYLQWVPEENHTGENWTLSFWMKHTKPNGYEKIFTSTHSNGISQGHSFISLAESSEKMWIASTPDHVTNNVNVVTGMENYTDTEWKHVMIVRNTAYTSTSGVKVYINGVEKELTINDNSATDDTYFGLKDYIHSIGTHKGYLDDGTKEFFEGYLAEIHFIDGQTLTKDDFGKSMGNKWIPKQPVISNYGSNGFYLNFSDQEAPGIDFSGNGNHWEMIGVWDKDGDKYTDQMLDSPTRNFTVLDHTKTKGNGVVANGNLYYSSGRDNGTNNNDAFGNMSVSAGKYYWENLANGFWGSSSDGQIGVKDNVSIKKLGKSFPGSDGDIIRLALNADNSKLWIKTDENFIINDVVSGINQTYSDISTGIVPYYGNGSTAHGTEITVNYGQGGQQDLNNYILNSNGTWRLAESYELPYARFKYLPPEGYRTLSDNTFYPDLTFTTSANKVVIGSKVKLDWNAENVISVTASSTDGAFTGNKTYSGNEEITLPDTEGEYTYTITATNDVGDVTEKSIKITVTNSYEIDYSLRFDKTLNQYLTKSNVNGNKQKWTLSMWIKHASDEVDNLFSTGTGSLNNGSVLDFKRRYFYHGAYNTDYIKGEFPSSINKVYNKWRHIVVVYNSTLPDIEKSDRLIFYIDGVKQTTEYDGSGFIPSLNEATAINNQSYPVMEIGRRTDYAALSSGSNNKKTFDGYMAEVNFVDGEALTASDFGEFRYNEWMPLAYTGAYGAAGFYLNFSDQTNLGKDYSGNNNNWTLVNYDSRKDGDKYIDQMLDSPTRNFAILDPLSLDDWGSPVDKLPDLSKGNLYFNSSTNQVGYVSSSIGAKNIDKAYVEMSGTIGGGHSFGFSGGAFEYWGGNEQPVNVINTSGKYGVTVDLSSSQAELFHNGVSKGTKVLNGGTSPYSYFISDISEYNDAVVFDINFGQGGQPGLKNYKIDISTGVWTEVTDGSVPDVRFVYSPPTGLYPLNEIFMSPDIGSFTADPTEVNSGSTTDLEWTVTGSVKEELWLDGNKIADITGQSPYTITPPEEQGEYTYILKTYSGAGLVSTKEIKITVTPAVSVESVQINDNNAEYRSNQKLEAVHTGLNPADGNLIYNWFVDRGSGSNTIADVIIPFDGNTVNDQSGNNNNGTLHDNESDGFNSNGKHGVGYEFDGVNDYIEMPTIGNLFNSDFSYSIWVYIPSETRTEDVSFFNVRNFDDNGAGDHRAGHIVLQSDDNIRFECKGDGDNVLLEKTKNLSITKDVYLHFVVSKRGNEFRFYYNGEEQADMRITTSGSTAIDDNNISLGRLNSNTVTGYFKGRVDELMIFDRALSFNQIKSVYDNGMRYIVPSETRVTDKWQVKVIPSNGTNTGEEKQSQQVTITASRRRLIVVETQ
jgi:hypothetical protein